MNFDLKQVPFSRFGSYFAIMELQDSPAHRQGVYLRTVHGDASPREIFRMELVRDGTPVPFQSKAEPWLLSLASEYGSAEICFSDEKTLRFRCSGVGLRLTMDDTGMFGYAMREFDGSYQINSLRHNRRFWVKALGTGGELRVDAPWSVSKCEKIQIDLLAGEDGGSTEYSLTESDDGYHGELPASSFTGCWMKVREEYRNWLLGSPAVPEKYAPDCELAAYINWSAVVAPAGLLKRNTMLMSKVGMTNIWSWDHCFNALALTNDLQLAFEQMMVIFDHQYENGQLPDSINDTYATYNFVKPPIHGWALESMMNRGMLSEAQLAEIYPKLVKWTNWWFDFRDSDGDGLPHYEHGNDSGWDNSTVFRVGPGVESPDLPAFLVIQMETLAKIADRIGRPAEAMEWTAQAAGLLDKLIAELWNGRSFFAREASSHKVIESQSLLTYMPIILGRHLPREIISAMVEGLKEKYVTKNGLPSESVTSPYYISDGYWRGPIWAPSTMLAVAGLLDAGETELALALSRSFCEMVSKNGIAENYDALTGNSLRDKSYTWTSSVFILLATGLK